MISEVISDDEGYGSATVPKTSGLLGGNVWCDGYCGDSSGGFCGRLSSLALLVISCVTANRPTLIEE